MIRIGLNGTMARKITRHTKTPCAKRGGKGWKAFQAMLDRPARRNPKLARLLKTKAPWD